MVTYVNALMQVGRPGDTEEKFWFPTTENPSKESEHSPIYRWILKKVRELAEVKKSWIPEKVKNNAANSYPGLNGDVR